MPQTDHHDERLGRATLTLCQRVKALREFHNGRVDHWAKALEADGISKEDFRRWTLLLEQHQDFVVTLNEIHSKLCGREIKQKEPPPTLEEVLFFGSEIGMTDAAARRFFNHFEARQWVLGGKVKLAKKNAWQARMRNWHADNQDRETRAAAQQVGGRKLADGKRQYDERTETPEL